MGTNRFFNNFNHKGEQNLCEDLVIECIKQYGIDVIYIPRIHEKIDLLYGEDVLNKFNDYFDIEMYIKNVDEFEGQGELFRKFGLDIKDQATLVVSRARFKEVAEGFGPFDLESFKPLKDPTGHPRPREGDLIYFPLNNSLFEIKFVQDEEMFYPFGTLYTYELQVEKFVHSDEEFETGIEEIDSVEKIGDYSIILNFSSGANNFQEDEKIYQGPSLANSTASAVVNYAHDDTKLEIRDIKGEFIPNNNVIGDTSGTTLLLLSVDDQEIVNDFSATNKQIEIEGDDIIDFSEDNPFSESDY